MSKIKKLLGEYSLTALLIFIYVIIIFLSGYSLVSVDFELDTLRNMISIVIGSVSSLLGIVIAVYILAISIFEQNFNKISFAKFMKTKVLQKYIQLCIITIIVMINANFSLNETITNFSLNILCFGIILYLFCLLRIAPTINEIVNDSKSYEPLKEILKQLNERSGKKYLESNDELTDNPFYSLSLIAENIIRRNERQLINIIMEKYIDLIKEKILENKGGEVNSCRDYINTFVKLFRRFYKTANETSHDWIMHRLLNDYVNIRSFGVENNISFYDFIEYEEFIEEICNKSIGTNNSRLAVRYLYFLKDFYKFNIELNLPGEEDIITFRDKENIVKKEIDHLKNSQWDYIASAIFSRIDSTIKTAIKREDSEVYSFLTFIYNSIFEITIKNDQLSTKQKRMLIMRSSYSMSQLIQLEVERISDLELLSTYNIITASTNNENSNIDLISILCNDFIELFPFLLKHKKINFTLLNDYGALGRQLSSHINDHEFIGLILKKLMNIMANTANTAIEKLELKTLTMYLEIYKEVESIFTWCKKNSSDTELLKELEEILSKMNEYETIQSLVEEDNFYLKML
ncbi:hypothetical protein HP456_15250, partial [Bacillus haikouensis]|uniref:hypothetical protein n=1 Tax=Bacillus haikouensis TaxID=1510468 RepID=UPI001555F345